MTKRHLFLLPFVFLAACKSPSKAFNQGDYNDAIELSVRKLQKDPSDAEARHVLQNAYSFAANQSEEKIHDLSLLTTDNRWEQMYYQYSQLQRLYDKINTAPAAVQAVKPVNYTSDLITYGDKAADMHVQKAVLLLNENTPDKSSYREAYYELGSALKFRPNDDDILKKLRDAKALATVNVLLVPMDMNGGYRYSASYTFHNFEADLARNIRNGINSEFLNFMTGWDSHSSQIPPEEVVEMRLGSITVGRPYDENTTRTATKDVVVKERVYSKDSVAKEYATVTARITTTNRTLVSTADMFLDIRNPAQMILWNDRVQAEQRWATSFATYTGDERALSDSDKVLLNKPQQVPPREDEIGNQLLHRLADNTTQRLRSYYSRY